MEQFVNIFSCLDLDEPKIVFTPGNITSEGDYVIITCDVQSSTVYTTTWFKDGISLPVTTPKIVVNNVGLNDEGKYMCQVNNDIATKSSPPARLYVQCKMIGYDVYF